VEWLSIVMFGVAFVILLTGYPVAMVLAGTALLFALIGLLLGAFDPVLLGALPSRLFGIMTNETLMAVPLFILMGSVLERARIAEDLLVSMSRLMGRMPGGLALAVVVVGAVLAASTGVVGATVVMMGLLALPTMLKQGYSPALSCGTICASGTLGQIIPPSIILVLLGDQLASAYTQAQLNQGVFAPESVSVGDLFAGAFIPGLVLVGLYLLVLFVTALVRPGLLPPAPVVEGERPSVWKLLGALVPALALIVAVLGSILFGVATPTEAAAIGAGGALLLAVLRGQFGLKLLTESGRDALRMTAMVFLILIAASLFSLVFRGLGGESLVHHWLSNLPGGVIGALIIVNLVMFLLGFVLDFIEIVFVVVPIVAPVLLMMGVDPVWLGVMIAINLQTSFLTPPFGFALFYLRGVAPAGVTTGMIYRGVIPFVLIQLFMLVLLYLFPQLATWLPEQIYGGH